MPAVTSVRTSVYPKKDEPNFLVGGLRANPGGSTRFDLTGGLASALGKQCGQSRLKLTGSGTEKLDGKPSKCFREARWSFSDGSAGTFSRWG
jgi:hypothetical protein